RPGKARLRSVLDLHNLTGVVALPFHFFFAFTGLLIFAATYYFPVGHTQLHELHDLHAQVEARETGLPHERAGVAAGLANVDAMVAEARRRWEAKGKAGEVGFLWLQHVGDANGHVSVYRAGTDRIALVGDAIHFKASTGELIREDPAATPVARVAEFLTGLHLQHFRHWLLRWLYVLGGLAGGAVVSSDAAIASDSADVSTAAALASSSWATSPATSRAVVASDWRIRRLYRSNSGRRRWRTWFLKGSGSSFTGSSIQGSPARVAASRVIERGTERNGRAKGGRRDGSPLSPSAPELRSKLRITVSAWSSEV